MPVCIAMAAVLAQGKVKQAPDNPSTDEAYRAGNDYAGRVPHSALAKAQ